MNFCLHGTNRTVKNTDSHAQRKMQCERLTSGLQVTAGTTATMHILNQTGGCQLNSTLSKCHGALSVASQHCTGAATHTRYKPQEVQHKNPCSDRQFYSKHITLITYALTRVKSCGQLYALATSSI